MRHGSLFSGIGGFDLAAQWMGWENVFHCEWNEFGKKILKYYWPNAISYDDITKTDFSIHRGSIDILTGGFPCQPYSAAGKRKGTADDRHLWPEMLRSIREIQPRYIVGENVRGLTNWNGGMVFDQVQADLEVSGYEVLPFLLPACAVNAPHRRDRIWFVAKNTNEDGWRSEFRQEESSIRKFRNIGAGNNERIQTDNVEIGTPSDTNNTGAGESLRSDGIGSEKNNGWRRQSLTESGAISRDGTTTDSSDKGLQGGESSGYKQREGAKPINEQLTGFNRRDDWQNFPTQPPICSRNDGISSRLDGITFPKWRNESIKGYGNAVVPEVPYQIFQAIEKYELQ